MQDDVAIHGFLCHVGRLRVLPTLAVVHALGETSEVSLSSVKVVLAVFLLPHSQSSIFITASSLLFFFAHLELYNSCTMRG